MSRILFAIAVVLSIIIVANVALTDTNDTDWTAVEKDPKAECARVNGTWRTYPSTCTDDCAQLNRTICGMALTPGCDCGETRCWQTNKTHGPRIGTCVPNPS